MENIISVVSHEGKNYFSITSSGGIEFLVTFLRMKYFAGQAETEFYHIEGWRSGCVVLNGYVSCYTENCFVATFDYSDVAPIHTDETRDGYMREFEVLSVEPFMPGDSLYTAVKGGILIADELHLAFTRVLAEQKFVVDRQKNSRKIKHANEELRYEEIGENKILVPHQY
ncbi:MAG: hypothetical protein KBC98_00095 [Candidatus Pacebacteria bacterium]|nr:hypothetical protein [Candidatus Paceibacterota bacterium]